MRKPDTEIQFGEWLPDLPPYNNPGLHNLANALPVDKTYKSFARLGTSFGTLPEAPLGSLLVYATSGSQVVYAGGNIGLYASTLGAFTALSAATIGSASWDFALYDDTVYAASPNTPVRYHPIGSGANFATAGAAPSASCIGRIGQFLLVGNTGGVRNRVRWCGIDNPQSWPTPLSSTAIAQQAGEQDLLDLGPIIAIKGGDQFGIVFQEGGITRVTYVGGSTVFQFDVISRNVGTFYPKSIVEYNDVYYFASQSGFYATDGVSIRPIGHGKVNRFFLERAEVGASPGVWAALDAYRKLIYWAYARLSEGVSATAEEILVYNYLEDRWGQATETTRGLIPAAYHRLEKYPVYAFNASNGYSNFSDETTVNALTAVFETGDYEFNLGGFARVSGMRPMVDSSNIICDLGTKSTYSQIPGYTASTTANALSGVYPFLNASESRFQRARIRCFTPFQFAYGVQVVLDKSSEK